MYLSKFAHKPVCALVLLDVALEVVRVLLEERHGQIAGQNVVQRGNIGGTLNRSVSAQRQNAAAGPSDISEQQLQNRRGADDLHAVRVLRPADRVADGCGFLRCRTPSRRSPPL